MEPHRASLIYTEEGGGTKHVRGAQREEPTPCHHHLSGKSGCHGSITAATFPLMMVGLATMICLLLISFGVLLCCYYKLLTAPHDTPSRAFQAQQHPFNDIDKEGTLSHNEGPTNKEVVVIMAGKSTPTFLALPIFIPESTSKETSLEFAVKKHALLETQACTT